MAVIQDAVRMEYNGTSSGSITFSAPSGHSYSAGKIDPYIDAHPDDVEWLTARSFVAVALDADGNAEDQAVQDAATKEHEETQRRAAEAERLRLAQQQSGDPVVALDVRQDVKDALIAGGFTDADALRAATDEQLLALDGVGTSTLFKVRQAYPIQE
jgi:PAS domain-containing protein